VTWRPFVDVHFDVDVHVAWRLDVVSPAARPVVSALR